jgi:hypothetical protein
VFSGIDKFIYNALDWRHDVGYAEQTRKTRPEYLYISQMEGISMLRKILCLVVLVSAPKLTGVAQSPAATFSGAVVQHAVFQGTTCQPVTLNNPTIVFVQLELDDGCVIKFNSSFSHVAVTVLNLTLHGYSTIDLSAPAVTGKIYPKPAPPAQAGYSSDGAPGVNGANGSPGASGPTFLFDVFNVTAPDGALWVRTDGSAGTNGSPGGDGGKGGGPNTSGVSCTDGGNGGTGGAGGDGGLGGMVAKVIFNLGPDGQHVHVGANIIPGFSPSSRPAAANIPGAIVVAGSIGASGLGAPGGNGGPGGEGRECHFPATNARAGVTGAHGRNGGSPFYALPTPP